MVVPLPPKPMKNVTTSSHKDSQDDQDDADGPVLRRDRQDARNEHARDGVDEEPGHYAGYHEENVPRGLSTVKRSCAVHARSLAMWIRSEQTSRGRCAPVAARSSSSGRWSVVVGGTCAAPQRDGTGVVLGRSRSGRGSRSCREPTRPARRRQASQRSSAASPSTYCSTGHVLVVGVREVGVAGAEVHRRDAAAPRSGRRRSSRTWPSTGTPSASTNAWPRAGAGPGGRRRRRRRRHARSPRTPRARARRPPRSYLSGAKR